MSLVPCPECKKEVSDSAKACPHCGKSLSTGCGCIGTIAIAFLAFMLAAAWIANNIGSPSAIIASTGGKDESACTIEKIQIRIANIRYSNVCAGHGCTFMRGVAVLTNGCPYPVGVEVKITSYSANGAPVATRELWPASVQNIPPGDYEFSLDHWLDYDPNAKKFDIRPVRLKLWP